MIYYLFVISRNSQGVIRDLVSSRYTDLETARLNFFTQVANGWGSDYQEWTVVLMSEEGTIYQKKIWKNIPVVEETPEEEPEE